MYVDIQNGQMNNIYFVRYVILMYVDIHDILYLQNNGSVIGRQPNHTCAGEHTTYTTDLIRTVGDIIPFLRFDCKGFVASG